MSQNKNYSLLFIADEDSKFDIKTKAFENFFRQADIFYITPEALRSHKEHKQEVIIIDLSVDPEKVAGVTALKRENRGQIIFALMDPKDTEKLYKVSNTGINAIELNSEQFDSALEMISKFDPADH